MNDTNLPLPYADDVETIPSDESDDIQRVIQAVELILARSQAKSGLFRGDVHVKTHGYAQGGLRVLPDLPDDPAVAACLASVSPELVVEAVLSYYQDSTLPPL